MATNQGVVGSIPASRTRISGVRSFPSFPPPFPLQILLPSSLPLTCSVQRCWCRQMIPFSLTSLQPKRRTQAFLHSSHSCKGGLAGNQTPPCQGEGLQAGREEGPTFCSMAYSTVRAAFLFRLHLLLSSYAFCTNITTQLWRGTMAWRGRKPSWSNISSGLVSRELWSGTSAAATPVSATKSPDMRLSGSSPLSLC